MQWRDVRSWWRRLTVTCRAPRKISPTIHSVISPAIPATSWSDPSPRRVWRSPPGVEFRQNVEVTNSLYWLFRYGFPLLPVPSSSHFIFFCLIFKVLLCSYSVLTPTDLWIGYELLVGLIPRYFSVLLTFVINNKLSCIYLFISYPYVWLRDYRGKKSLPFYI